LESYKGIEMLNIVSIIFYEHNIRQKSDANGRGNFQFCCFYFNSTFLPKL